METIRPDWDLSDPDLRREKGKFWPYGKSLRRSSPAWRRKVERWE